MPGFYVYHNNGVGPVDYDTVQATLATSATVWTSAALSYPATWRFGLRAYNTTGEEKNVNRVELVLDASGNDVTAHPNAITNLVAKAVAGGIIRLTWSYDNRDTLGICTKFNIYGDDGTGSVDLATPVDTVMSKSGQVTNYTWDSSALTHGTTYRYIVRASTVSIEESNTREASAVADSDAPAQPASLTITVTR